jgi:catalase
MTAPSLTARPAKRMVNHLHRERAPHREAHAKGAAAHGFFEATRDVSDWTCADFLENGKRTPVLAHFSLLAGGLGSADTVRDTRGFALKFFTDDGIYDVAGNNTPVFFMRDASKVSNFIYSQRRMSSWLRSNEAEWDFWTLSPESAHQVAILMSDRGLPRTLRHMNGYGVHTYSWINGAGDRFWVKYHFKSVQGIANFSAVEADVMAAADPDYHRRDLWTAVAVGDSPEWRLEVQVMPFEDAADYRFNPFDATKVWPHDDYPPIVVGRLVLDRNPVDRFAQIKETTFSPANLVPGIGLSPDRLLMSRVALHEDPESNELGRYAYARHAHDDDFAQARALYREVMDDVARERLVRNIAEHASDGVSTGTQRRVVGYWEHVDPELGRRVAAALAHS